MEALPDRAAGFLGGDFADEYRKYIDAIVAPNKQAQVTNTTQVMGAAVESLTATEATAIVYTNSVATSPVTKNIPSLRYLSYRLTMQRHDAKWLITRDVDRHVVRPHTAAVGQIGADRGCRITGLPPFDARGAATADIRDRPRRRGQRAGTRPRVRRQHDGQHHLPRLLARPAHRRGRDRRAGRVRLLRRRARYSAADWPGTWIARSVAGSPSPSHSRS